SKNPEEISLGIDALGKTGDERFWVNLRTFLGSEQPELRLGAMRSMNRMVRIGEIHEHLGILQNLLRDPVRETRTLAIQIISRVRTPHSISLLVDALSDSSPRNRRLAMEGLSFFGGEIVSPLMLLLDDPRASIPAQEAAVRLLNLSQDPDVHERLQRFAFDRIKAMYEYKLDEQILRTESQLEDTDYLATVLDEKARMLLKLVLAHVAPDQRSSEARQVFKNLYSANQEMMSNAIEVLQSMGERTLIFHILPILEGLPLDQIASYGTRIFRLESRNVQMVIGRYLLSLDPHLKEASVYTIGRLRLTELEPAVRKIQNSEKLSPELVHLIDWAIDQMTVRTRTWNAAGEKKP
ncbi:MAG TPA: HEAT repeat domain-containing protein, partial [Candidatus Ozemobacteraceae bacterium]|nr:HEAT repeat domain-containing protein [Candidatus Ozemobacteraceae bacterium]